MALPRNKLVPIFAVFALLIVGAVAWKSLRGGPVKAGPSMTAAPEAPKADADSPVETLRTVVAANAELRRQVQTLLEHQRRGEAVAGPSGGAQTREQVQEMVRSEVNRQSAVAAEAAASSASNTTSTSTASTAPPTAGDSGTAPQAGASTATEAPSRRKGLLDKVGESFNNAVDGANMLAEQFQLRRNAVGGSEPKATGSGAKPTRPEGVPGGLGYDDGEHAVAYKVFAPLGYAESKERGPNGQTGGLVRTKLGGGASTLPAAAPPPPDVVSAAQERAEAEKPIPYFTIPQNATLTRVTTMTSLIGRVPVDGKVTDPMQFKVLIGRENLAASGQFVPNDVSGIVVSGIAVGDMAMSCSEGHIYSLTFVFEDGTVRTVNAGQRNAGGGSGDTGAPTPTGGVGGSAAGGRKPLGYLSDLWGNPCIAGKFVTNAPQHLTDLVGLRSLGVASRAYAAAQTTTQTNGITGGESSSVTGSRGAYVMGQAAAGATDEVTNWLLQRLKNSFDAVVTPAGQKVVVHIDQEIAIDKAPLGRRLDHRSNLSRSARPTGIGALHGLD